MTNNENPFDPGELPRVRPIIKRRVDATQATVDHYTGKPFEVGKVDCWKVAAYHLRQIGRPMKFNIPVAYRSLLQGRTMLRKVGFASLSDLLSDRFEVIAPAACLPGDIIELAALEDEETKGLGALVIYLGNNAVFGFHEAAEGATVMRIGETGTDAPLRAWRVI